MHRIDTKTAQKDKFGAGKNGFTRGNPQTGTPATDLDDDYFDMLQEELCSVVEASGASLEKARHDQLLTALRALLLSRKNPFGDIKSDGTVKTALENLGLGEGAKLNAATATLGRTGFIAIPVMIGGIEQSVIIQWGWNAAKASASGGDGNTVVFPVAFNNACVAVVANYDNVSATINAVATGGYTTTSFLLRCTAQTGSYYYNWIAIGY
ncbi:hypothetical protein AAH349_003383 [Escherichia coli]|uniref:gp53-like domain-containing protein n=1 Tax=Escherichia coli TaxID=562 RepID=UPI001CBB90C7|nr:protein StfP [Escherichia coli]MDN1525400.1 hypothetical protein [Escherichia coli]UAO56567.1 hypothetical protein J6N91_17895 [Escherichia coli]